MATTTLFPEAVRRWLQTPIGAALLQQESRVVEEAFDGIFGEYCLQLGLWGEPNTYLRFARTQRTALIVDTPLAEGGSAIGLLHRLPIASDSIDSVLLPHTLDYMHRPHALLREVDRVLRSDGQLVILGFKPGGPWALRRLVPGAGWPPGGEYLVAERRLRDWLKLLDFRIHGSTRYFFRWPFPGRRSASSARWERRGQRWWPELAACYSLTAQKRISTLTPVRPVWRRKPQVVPGLAEPTARVSRIHFDQND